MGAQGTEQLRKYHPSGKYSISGIDVDENGDYRSSYDVYIQDQTSDIVDLYLSRILAEITLADDAAVNTRFCSLAPGHGAVVGNWLCIKTNGNWYHGRILTVIGDNITIDMPFNRTYESGQPARIISPDMNVDGSVTPVVFRCGPGPGQKWDITRMLLLIRDDATMYDGKFGGLPELPVGIMIRAKKSDAEYENLFTARNNGAFAVRTSDAYYTEPSRGPSGQSGFRVHRAFSGQDRNGVVIRLDGDTGGEFQIIVNDNLTGLTHMRAVIQGHIVED